MAANSARLLLGGPIAQDIDAAVAADAAAFRETFGHVPTLAVVVCGHDAPSMVYLRQILRSCERVGLKGRLVGIESEAAEADLVTALYQLDADPEVAGIIVQMPLPAGVRLRAVVEAIDPTKDIDGIHPLNAGLLRLGYDGFLPATAHAAIEILKRSGIDIAGREAVVIGRSTVVGMPAAFMLVHEDATVTVCHRRTRDLRQHVRRAEILVVAAGHPGLVTGDMLRRGAVVVDVGINVVEGHVVGDVDFGSAVKVASAITPVPGGVGPLTNALLLAHLMRAARRQAGTSGAPPAELAVGVAASSSRAILRGLP